MPHLTDPKAVELLERLVDYARDSEEEQTISIPELEAMTLGDLVEDIYTTLDAPLTDDLNDEVVKFWPRVCPGGHEADALANHDAMDPRSWR